MTKLSLLIYLADVASTANGWAIGFGVLFGIVLIVLGIVALCLANDGCKVPYGKKTIFIISFAFVASVACSILIPSQKTVYLIAGVEAAKELGKTELAKEASSEAVSVMKDVTKIIHDYAKKTSRTSSHPKNDED